MRQPPSALGASQQEKYDEVEEAPVEESAPAPVSRFKTSSFKPADELSEPPKSTLVQDDGGDAPMDTERDVDGQPMDDDVDEEHQEVVDAESGDEGAARQDVDRGREEEAGGWWDVREEGAPAGGIADAGGELDGRVDEVEDEKADKEGAQRGAEEGAMFLWPRGRCRVHAPAKVPSEAAHGKHEPEGIPRGHSTIIAILGFSFTHVLFIPSYELDPMTVGDVKGGFYHINKGHT